MAQLFTYTQKTPNQIRDDILRTIKNGLIRQGITSPNVGPGSDYFLLATAIGNEIAVGQANNVLLADQFMPDTASGTFLDRWLAVFGLSRRAAIGSSGLVTIVVSVASTLISAGQQLIDSAGLRYQVLVGGNYGTGTGLSLQVPVVAVDGGQATNHANGDVLTWVVAPAYCDPSVTVGIPGGTDGLSGGFDSEVGVDEPPRARLLATLQNPPSGGNWSAVATTASNASPYVQGAFVYPALLGPGTTFFAVTRAPQTSGVLTSTSKNRDISFTLINSVVAPFVQGSFNEHAFVVGATVKNQPVDVGILLSLPASPAASPPGVGGGWIDGTPWPPSIGGTAPTIVTSVTSPTNFVVNAAVAAQPGVSHISWINPSDWTTHSAVVLSCTGAPGAFAITIDTPMPGIVGGHYIFPTSQNQSAYISALFAAFATMGPGEWTTNPSALVRAFRHPVPTQTWPSSLGASQLKQIQNVGPEVQNATWLFRSAISPTIPPSITVNVATQQLNSDPPSILVPRNIALLAA